MLVLGIETSCDETSAAVVEDGRRALSSVVWSQSDIHSRYGGVVPELASRAHVEKIGPVIEEALAVGRCSLKDVSAIAVTRGPGLVGALLVGLHVSKGLSAGLGVPLIGVNHLQSHVYALFLEEEVPSAPLVVLIVSGGHTLLVYIPCWGQYEVVAETRDDAAGEAYDKVAKILSLGYPGGPRVDQMARAFKGEPVRFPKARMKDGRSDFSFSGLKTAVLYHVRNLGRPPSSEEVGAIVAGFQRSVIDVLTDAAFDLCRQRQCHRLAVVGGVASNQALREQLKERGGSSGVKLYAPKPSLCTDNAAMTASLGYTQLQEGRESSQAMDVAPNLSLEAF